MSLLGGLIQLLQNTVSSVNLSVGAGPVLAEEILIEHIPAVGGVFRVELHMFDSPPLSVAVRVGGSNVFIPATTAIPGAGVYSIQVTSIAGQHIRLVALADLAEVFADMIITQIG